MQYIRRELGLYALGLQEHLANEPGKDPAGALSNQLAQILVHCDRFRTPDGHVDHLRSLGWEEAESGRLRDSIATLIETGNLRSRADFIEKLGGVATEEPRHITTLAWTTCNRIESLSRSVTSFMDSASRYGWNLRFAVIDNSIDSRDASEARRILRGIAAGSGRGILYAGAEEKESFIDSIEKSLLSEDVPPEVLSFALRGDSAIAERYGANRNATLLAFPDELLLSLDDDTICRFFEPPQAMEELEICDGVDPTELTLLRDRDELRGRLIPHDVVSAHEALLGKTVQSCLTRAGALRLDRLGPRMVHLLEQGRGRVFATVTGIAGDSAAEKSTYVLALQGDSRDRLLGDPRGYIQAALRRDVLKIASHPTIARAEFIVNLCLGLDHTQLLPPYFPVGRNEDGLFARALIACHPDAFLGHVPLGIQHEPPIARSYQNGDRQHFSLRINDILGLLTEKIGADLRSFEPAQRMDDLGRRLESLGQRKPRDFREDVSAVLLSYLEQYAAYMEEILERNARTPRIWVDDVTAHLEAVQTYISGRSFGVPAELRGADGASEGAGLFQALVRRYGRLLRCWPRIREAAVELNLSGKGLAKPLQ
jgi:hypothetical protein